MLLIRSQKHIGNWQTIGNPGLWWARSARAAVHVLRNVRGSSLLRSRRMCGPLIARAWPLIARLSVGPAVHVLRDARGRSLLRLRRMCATLNVRARLLIPRPIVRLYAAAITDCDVLAFFFVLKALYMRIAQISACDSMGTAQCGTLCGRYYGL